MPTILSDHDVEGHLAVMLAIWTSDDWRDFWETLNCTVETFGSLGISQRTPDSDLWQFCQDRQIVLLTGNRNADGEDSLETTIQRHTSPKSLPVVTIGDPDRVMVDRHYAEAAAVQTLDFLINIESLRGSKRLWVP